MDLRLDSDITSGDASGDNPGASTAATHGWQKVSYPKRQRRQQQTVPPSGVHRLNVSPHPEQPNVFASVEKKALDRRHAIESAADAAVLANGSRPSIALTASDEDEESSGTEIGRGVGQDNGMEGEKKIKQKKPKKPKITVQEAAVKINDADLATFLADVSASYELQEQIQLMRFADYFGRAFSSVSASQFPWAKMFQESPLSKIVEVPISSIQSPVYSTSVDWIAQKSPEALGEFVLWCLDGILADLASQQAAAKSIKKATQPSPSKSQVAVFVVLAMTLRRKPDILITLLPKLRDNSMYHGQEKVPVFVWIIAQVSQVDLLSGMHVWAHFLLPLICGKSGNPQTRGFALQLVERILAQPKARSILLNGAVRKGERLVPPSALDLLMRLTFPAPSARLKATERFEEVYPTLKELALVGSRGTKSTKQASQQILPYTVKAMQENNPVLTQEAASIFIWCLSQNPDCYKQWEKIYSDNMDASISVLRKLSQEWNEHSVKLTPTGPLKETLEHMRLGAMNAKSSSPAPDTVNEESIKELDKYCKVLLGRLTRKATCIKSGVVVLALAVAVGFVLAPDMDLFGPMKLQALLSSLQSP